MKSAARQGWATSDDWFDDSAAAAGRFFEAGKKPSRPGSQGWATNSWAEGPSITADECVALQIPCIGRHNGMQWQIKSLLAGDWQGRCRKHLTMLWHALREVVFAEHLKRRWLLR